MKCYSKTKLCLEVFFPNNVRTRASHDHFTLGALNLTPAPFRLKTCSSRLSSYWKTCYNNLCLKGKKFALPTASKKLLTDFFAFHCRFDNNFFWKPQKISRDPKYQKFFLFIAVLLMFFGKILKFSWATSSAPLCGALCRKTLQSKPPWAKTLQSIPPEGKSESEQRVGEFWGNLNCGIKSEKTCRWYGLKKLFRNR